MPLELHGLRQLGNQSFWSTHTPQLQSLQRGEDPLTSGDIVGLFLRQLVDWGTFFYALINEKAHTNEVHYVVNVQTFAV